jgi:hypothetical protein
MDAALAGIVDAYGLTAMQEGMLYHTLAERGSGVYVNQIVTPVSGDLDVSVLRSAWDSVVARHDILRTAYVWDGLDDPLQVVHAAVDHPWEDVDLAHVPQADLDEHVDHVLTSDRERGFDVATAPLSRMLLIRTGERQWLWVWSFHHLIADGWSAQILRDEVIATYRASAQGRPLELPEPPAYRDFVAHYQARDTEAEQTYWTQRLAGFAEPLDLVVPGLPPAEGATGYRTQYRTLDRALTDDLVALARSHHVTLNTVFVAIWALVVSRWAGTKDVVFGTTVAGRPPREGRAGDRPVDQHPAHAGPAVARAAARCVAERHPAGAARRPGLRAGLTGRHPAVERRSGRCCPVRQHPRVRELPTPRRSTARRLDHPGAGAPHRAEQLPPGGAGHPR